MTQIADKRRRGPKRWIPRQWRDRVQLYNDHGNFERQKQEAYDDMDRDGFGYWTVFTAGAGFCTGAYDIFAVNTVMPLVNIVYWGGRMPTHTSVSISMASLIGTLLGQVVWGILGDRYGRKKMFYRLLVGLIIGTIFLALVSKGAQNSLDIQALIIFWRIWMGLFIGGDYPLSAAITAEFAPREHRGRMISTVFFGQPIGQLLACLVPLITTSALRNGLSGASQTHCTGQCLHTADIAWRWIVGFGAVPPIFALVLRWYLPESPRWLLEVERNPMGIDAAAYTKDKFYADPLLDDDIEFGSTHSTADDSTVPDEHQSLGQYRLDENCERLEAPQEFLSPPPLKSQASSSTAQDLADQNEEIDFVHTSKSRPMAPKDLLFKDPKVAVTNPDHITPMHSGAQYAGFTEEYLPEPAPQENTPLESPSNEQTALQPELESWADFFHFFGIYLFGEEPWTWGRLWLCLQFQDQHFFDGSWTDLAGLSSTWFLLDFGFYFLIVNSFKLMTKIWGKEDPDDVYIVISQYAWRIIASTSVGGVTGGAIFIAMARNRWKLQFYGFLSLVVLFVVVGIVFIKLIDGPYFATFIVLYCFCHLTFNLGPNFSTFVIAAEVFPTKYRASCHGISAAAGKFGSVLTQVFLSEVKINGRGVNDARSHWLGWALIIQGSVMLIGAIFTWFWVPDPCDISGNPRSLEDLGLGKQARKAMERAEKKARAENQSRTH